ncbi:uncharacterized protein LOC133178528 isoform X2 [Saccostrea echinata]|uniref:uncharacterized protein LOC133178528 isoform X2 n=1 Tax=Saccostrea echinata TaxID=191078 RepID=UPI002A83342F|nr:uncharacterized protein LOC133178528 isoform X2 [Saccostrea echinata]
MEGRKRAHSDAGESASSSPPHDSDTEKSTTTLESSPTTSSSEPSSENDSFPNSTSKWRRSDIDKLGIKLSYRACAMDVVYEWGLYTMFRKDVVSEELNTVEEILYVCNSIEADFTSFEELQRKFIGNPAICNEFVPTEKMPDGIGLCSCRFEEFQQKMELVLREGIEVNASVSESNFQTLFEDFLKICGIITRHQPDIAIKKMKVKGEIVSSAPDILCYGLEGKVLCVIEIFGKVENIKGEDTYGSPVIKKTRHASSEVDPCLPDALLAQHIGELLAYLDNSVTHMDLCGSVGRDILGFTVEKTQVTVTHLQLTELSWEKIQNTTRKGSLKHMEKPVLHYSRRYDFLKKSDRQELFKVILHIKLMHSVHEKVAGQRKTKGTTNILSKKKF